MRSKFYAPDFLFKHITFFIFFVTHQLIIAQPTADLDMMNNNKFHVLKNYIDSVKSCNAAHPATEIFCADTSGNRPSAGDTTFYYFSYGGYNDTLYVLSNGTYGPLPQAAVYNLNIVNVNFKFPFLTGCNPMRLIVKNITGSDTAYLIYCRDAPDGFLTRTGASDTVCLNTTDTLYYTMTPTVGSIDSVKWNFGDTSYTTIGYTTNHIFNFPLLGKKTVTVTIYDMGTTCDYNILYDTVHVVFDGDITVTDSAGCPCNNIILKGVSSKASSFTWIFPDTTLVGATVNYTSSMPGAKHVSVIGTAPNGCVVSNSTYLDICPNEYINSLSANYWYFGGSGLNFNTNPPTALSNGRLLALEGCAAASDPFTGQLLFYTNGIYVYNRNHVQMPNGFGLFADESTTQGALIVPRPGNKNQYYIFTHGGGFGVTTKRLHYSIVDMTANGGLGDVITKNVQVQPDGPGNQSSELLTGMLKSSAYCDSTDKYWIVNPIELSGTWNFISYEVTANGPILRQNNALTVGVNRHTEIISSVFSPDGKLYVAGNRPGGFVLMDFDKNTGVLSNVRHVETGSPSYGIAFSADGKKLYVTRFLNSMLQFDLTTPSVAAITASQVKIDSVSTLRGLYRGPDDKIYVNEQGKVGVIHFPNLPGAACKYEKAKYTFNSQFMLMGLQNIVPLLLDTNATKVITSNYSYIQDTCTQNYTCNFTNLTDSVLPLATYDPCKFNPRDTLFYEWVYGDGTRDTFLIVQGGNQQHTHPTHNYSGPGSYNAQLIYWSTFTCERDTFSQTIIFNPAPAPTVVNPPAACDSIIIGGNWYYTTQSVMDTLAGASQNGCDSIVQYNVVINNSSTSIINPVACLSYTSPGGKIFTSTGVYLDTISSFNGCDSIITINLTMGAAVTSTVTIPACDSILTNGNWYYTSQTVLDTIPGGAVGGCDSIVNLVIIINSSQANSGNAIVCSGQSVLIHGTNQNVAGVYTQTFTGSTGCDSISSITLTVHPSYAQRDTVSSCDSVLFGGTWYNTSQVLRDTLTTTLGCDSIFETYINVVSTPSLTIVPLIDSVTPGSSITLTASGGASYYWDNGSTTAFIVVTPSANTYYCVVSTNANCSDSVCAQVIVFDNECADNFYMPTAFSPNGDGQNDELCIYGAYCVTQMLLRIYDRWGELVYSSTDVTKCWNGIYNNKKLDAGVFTFKLNVVFSGGENHSISGNVTLVQ